MTIIAHLSDLHFGAIDQAVADALVIAVQQAQPDIVVVSGDLTQRARKPEFVAAQRFLNALPKPQIVVPGNHDVPLYNLFKRFFAPLSRYRRFISPDICPYFSSPGLAIAGLNTARSLTFKGGRLNREQLGDLKRRFASEPPDATRIVVTHHPFEGASATDAEGIVGRAQMAMQVFAEARVDVILSGHLHFSRLNSSALRYAIEGYAALLIQAGTATSLRRRAEVNSFNLLRVARPTIDFECHAWSQYAGRFVVMDSKHFRLGADGWQAAQGDVVPTVVQQQDTLVKHDNEPFDSPLTH
jgi:3',5'-cyclic AMP phosphodiesterase CpdA